MAKYLLTTISPRFLPRATMQMRFYTSEPNVRLGSGDTKSVAELDHQRPYTPPILDIYDFMSSIYHGKPPVGYKTLTLRKGIMQVPIDDFPDRHDYLTKELKQDWTIDEETSMKKMIGNNSVDQIKWKRIQENLTKKRYISQIKEYYERVIQPSSEVKDDAARPSKHEFSEEEDAALMDAVRNHGTMSFHTIKKEMNSTRSTADLRRRYDNFLDPAIPDEERPHPRTSREYSQKPSRDKYPYYRVRVRQVGWI